MTKLLVINPQEIQQLIEVGQGGGYFDPSRVLWDEREDTGEIDPAKVGGYSRVDDELVYSQEDFDAHEALKVTLAASDLTALKATLKVEGKKIIDDLRADGIVQRAVAKITMDELNILRAWLASFKTEVAAASSLADLKTRVASLPATPARTIAQLKTAIKNEIDSGNSDA